MLVAEGHWLECKERFARIVHRFDRILVTRRGSDCSKVTSGIYDNWYARWNSCATNPSDVRGSLRACCTDSDFLVLALSPRIADVDVAVTVGKISTGVGSHSDITAPSLELPEGFCTDSGIVVASVEIEKGASADGRIKTTACTVFQCRISHCHVD